MTIQQARTTVEALRLCAGGWPSASFETREFPDQGTAHVVVTFRGRLVADLRDQGRCTWTSIRRMLVEARAS